MGSALCRPHTEGVCCKKERRKKEKRGGWSIGEMESDTEEIMKSRKEIKRERNQGEKMRGQRDTGKTLNEKEMGS